MQSDIIENSQKDHCMFLGQISCTHNSLILAHTYKYSVYPKETREGIPGPYFFKETINSDTPRGHHYKRFSRRKDIVNFLKEKIPQLILSNLKPW